VVPAATATHAAKHEVVTPTGSSSTGPAANDGVYAGQVCYAATAKLEATCYQADGTVKGEKISGQWAMGGDLRATMFLTGEVSPAGDVTIEMHSQKPDGSPLAVINMAGKLHDGMISARGTFLRGRPATLEWRKTSR
jgi:hypothetical protein